MSEIVKQGNHYCIGLKANQRKLLECAQQCGHSQQPLSRHQTVDSSHGRVVTRHVQVYAAPASLQAEWAGLAAFARIERVGMREENQPYPCMGVEPPHPVPHPSENRYVPY